MRTRCILHRSVYVFFFIYFILVGIVSLNAGAGEEQVSVRIKDVARISYVHDIPVQDHVLWTLNGRITATEAHPFLTTEGWKSANPEASAPIYESYGIAIGKLEVGDILVGSSSNVELSSLESKEERVKVYNFTTESTHTYMVDGVVSHNKSRPPLSDPSQPPPPRSRRDGNDRVIPSDEPLGPPKHGDDDREFRQVW